MTENEAIKNFQQELKEPLSPFSITMCNMAIKALQKVQSFEAIGTVEEFKALKEKLQGYKNQMSIYAEQHKVILASDVLDMLEELDWSE